MKKLSNLLYDISFRRREQAFVKEKPFTADQRRKLLRGFTQIHRNVEGYHTSAELLFLAKTILGSQLPGPIVECGSFHGASSAKLSLVAELTGRKLYICDSFQGLPPGEETHGRADGKSRTYKPGDFSGSLEEVRGNIAKWGSLAPCIFVQGFFADSLPGLDVAPAVVFIDVDYVSSARDCLQYLWPRLLPGGYFFTHEANFLDYVNGITDSSWWHEALLQCPPLLYGARFGVDRMAPALGYFYKPAKVPV